MKVKLLKINNDVVVPHYQTKDAAGFDFVANNFKRLYYYDSALGGETTFGSDELTKDNILLEPGERVLIGTGLKMELPEGYELQIRPRSGLALNDGITVLNSPGTIDADYRGEIGIILINQGNVAHKITLGNRIAQGVLKKYEQAEFNIVEDLDTTERTTAGFGSTGT